MITLAEIALEMGIPKSYLSPRWKGYGWVPVGKVGGALAFSPLAIAEWRLAKRGRDGKVDIYWLPWRTEHLFKVLAMSMIYTRLPQPPHYLTRPRTGKGRDPKFYSPLEIRHYATTYGYPYHFLLGFEGEAREKWAEQISIWESFRKAGSQDELETTDPADGGEVAKEEMGQRYYFNR